MEIKQSLLDSSKYSLKCPYQMTPAFIIVHDTYNDASAKNEIAYMVSNSSSTSFHIAVDDIEAIQGIPFDRNSWNCGDGKNGKGNRNGISIEICYSKSGGERWEKAKANAAELIAQLLKQYGWGIERVNKHQDFNGKYCPHRILDEGWENFLNLIREKLGQTVSTVIENKPVQVEEKQPVENKKIDVKYQIYTKGKWYNDIVNYNEQNDMGYAGVFGQPISCFRGNTVGSEADAGKLIYRVHTLKGKWLGEITDRNKDKFGDDFAGIKGKAIDGISIKTTKGTARYRVHTVNGKWLKWISKMDINDYYEGMAGAYGKAIDAIQIEII